MRPIETRRLLLIPGTAESGRAELQSPAALAECLDVEVAARWPPDLYDADAIGFMIALLERDPKAADWGFYYFALRRPSAAPLLIGAGGYKGKPGDDGTVEIGYSVLAAYQRRGYATEAAIGLVARAFADPRVTRVIAETLPGLVASIGVLEKIGFRLLGEGSEPGVIRYELTRLTSPP